MSEQAWEVVIVGAGAAGMSAALILAQARRRVLVIESGEARNRFDDHQHGYLSRSPSRSRTATRCAHSAC